MDSRASRKVAPPPRDRARHPGGARGGRHRDPRLVADHHRQRAARAARARRHRAASGRSPSPAASRSRSPSAAPGGTTPTGTGQTIYRIGFYTSFAVVAVIAARARERATALAAANETLAVELRGTQARLDGILGSLGEAVTVHDERGKTVYVNEAAVALLGSENVEEVLAAEPGELAERFAITREDGSPVRLEDLPGPAAGGGRGRAVAADPQRAARHRRGDVAADQGDALHRPVGRAPGHQHHRGRHGGQGRRAAPALPGRGRPAARHLARLRADARARGAHDRAGARRLVRHRHGRRARRVAAGGGRPRRSGEGRARARPAQALPPDPDAPTGVPAILRGGPAELYTEIPTS